MTEPKVSRQRAWQLRKQAEGLCRRCGKPRWTLKTYCTKCGRKVLDSRRKAIA